MFIFIPVYTALGHNHITVHMKARRPSVRVACHLLG